MDAIKRLQAQYKNGKLTAAQYAAKLAELLEAGDITQEQHDTAKEFDPDDDGANKPVYSQADVDGFIAKKAKSLVRKLLTEAGVDMAGITNANILEEAGKLVKAGSGKKTDDSELAKENEKLRKQLAASGDVAGQLNDLRLENAVYKALGGGKFKAVNPAQVVRAIKADYADLIDYDEDTGLVVGKTIEKAVRKVAETEPNLFHAPEAGDGDGDGDGDDGDGNEGDGDEGPTFKGKAPGGGPPANKQAQYDALKKQGLALMGIKKDDKK